MIAGVGLRVVAGAINYAFLLLLLMAWNALGGTLSDQPPPVMGAWVMANALSLLFTSLPIGGAALMLHSRQVCETSWLRLWLFKGLVPLVVFVATSFPFFCLLSVCNLACLVVTKEQTFLDWVTGVEVHTTYLSGNNEPRAA